MLAQGLVQQLQATAKFLETSTAVLEEAESGFAPQPELYTVAAHVAHIGRTVDWFMEGAFGKGWEMDFEADIARAKTATSLTEARAETAAAFERAIATIGKATDEELTAPISDDAVMGSAPRMSVVSGIVDHTAHHRGALTVYSRLLGKVPAMPYS